MSVRNDNIGGSEFVGAIIEGGKLFTFVRHAHADFAVQLVRIEGVEGLAGLQHDQICDINDIVDRTQTDRLQLALKPVRARSDLHVRNFQHGIKRTFRRIDTDRAPVFTRDR